VSDDLHPHAIGTRGQAAARTDGTAARRFAVSAERLLQDWKAAHARAVAYLEALGVAEEERDGLAACAVERAVEGTGEAVSATLRAVRELVAGGSRDEFRAWRLERLLAPGPRPSADGTLCSAPPLERRSMVSEPMDLRFFRRFFGLRRGPPAAAPAERALYGRPLRQLRRRSRTEALGR